MEMGSGRWGLGDGRWRRSGVHLDLSGSIWIYLESIFGGEGGERREREGEGGRGRERTEGVDGGGGGCE